MVGGAGVTAALADDPPHYYLELGGTGAVPADGSSCTRTYGYANQHLNGGHAILVCYPASAGPFVGSHNEMPAPTAPSMDESARQGYRNMLKAVEDTYHAHPDAKLTIVGYSLGAWPADLVLQKLASGTTDVPREQVDGMLYSDPMQPGTGIAAKVPKGVGIFGMTSPGPGPEHFDGIPVQRFCIHHDGVCDATSIESFPGYLKNHPTYPVDGGIITQTIGHDGGDGIVWYQATS